jgi:hypothetical protein
MIFHPPPSEDPFCGHDAAKSSPVRLAGRPVKSSEMLPETPCPGAALSGTEKTGTLCVQLTSSSTFTAERGDPDTVTSSESSSALLVKSKVEVS